MTRTLNGHAKAYLLIAKHSCFLDNTSSSRQSPDLIYMFSEAKPLPLWSIFVLFPVPNNPRYPGVPGLSRDQGHSRAVKLLQKNSSLDSSNHCFPHFKV